MTEFIGTHGAGGAVSFDAQVVTFSGGGYDGWRGARIDDAIVFRKDPRRPAPGSRRAFS